MRSLVARALEQYGERRRVPWVQVEVATSRIAGTTSYHDVSPGDRGLCIGHT
ncbi:hypothetical protein [Spongiactinospora sp. TRM90649]|uniref:hypothetical protein n=1 Tax=Spongiactinospora sp. TRM90649 TaxID=3031114 RepID=UPI0023F88353|nr:hypothetical protein [Spongiactinospora sp. TRM90649]MDF5755320.1 hypothetical protein [Spongiactinospora sp. TRM90649]